MSIRNYAKMALVGFASAFVGLGAANVTAQTGSDNCGDALMEVRGEQDRFLHASNGKVRECIRYPTSPPYCSSWQ